VVSFTLRPFYPKGGDMRNAYKILAEKPEVKLPLGRQRRRSEDNIRMNLKEIGWNVADWMRLA